MVGWIPAAGGFVLGVAFLMAMDSLLPHLHPNARDPEGMSSSWKRTTLLVLAVTLHNIPEGMAVGLSFALAAQHGNDPALYASAMALAIGIAPEFPGRRRDFPAAAAGRGLIGPRVPVWQLFRFCGTGLWCSDRTDRGRNPAADAVALSFAAGAMLYVVVEELIQEAHLGDHSNVGTLGVMAGFLIMMILDVALG